VFPHEPQLVVDVYAPTHAPRQQLGVVPLQPESVPLQVHLALFGSRWAGRQYSPTLQVAQLVALLPFWHRHRPALPPVPHSSLVPV